MKQYDVRIREMLERAVTVEAQSAEHARSIVEKSWKNRDYILDADDFSGVSFQVLPPKSRDFER